METHHGCDLRGGYMPLQWSHGRLTVVTAPKIRQDVDRALNITFSRGRSILIILCVRFGGNLVCICESSKTFERVLCF